MALVLIDRTAGTNIGDMTGNGGLAAAFDGTTDAGTGSCATVGNTGGYVGKTLASAKKFGRAIVYGSNTQGVAGNFNGTTTINIRGKNGAAPSSRTDGTIVGTLTFTDSADGTARQIETSDAATLWDHIFADIIPTGGNVTLCAELVLYEFRSIAAQAVWIG